MPVFACLDTAPASVKREPFGPYLKCITGACACAQNAWRDRLSAPRSSRVSEVLLRRLAAPFNSYFQHRQPGALTRVAISIAAPFVRTLAPNDKWTLAAHVPLWMKVVREPPQLPLPPAKRVFLLSGYRGQFTLDLTMAALLAWRGHTVTIGYLNKLGSPIKDPLNDHEECAPYLAAALSRVETASGGRVRCIDLSNFSSCDSEPDFATLDQQARADSIMRLGVETIDASNPEHADALRYYRDLGLSAHRSAAAYFLKHRADFDLAIIPNGMSFEASYFSAEAKRAGLPLVTLEKFAFRNTRVVTHGDAIFTFKDLTRLWDRRASLGFERLGFRAAAINRARSILEERRRASTQNWAWKYQFAPDQTDAQALETAGIDSSKPYVLICTNVPFDAGYYQFTKLFGSMKEWLQRTVAFLLEKTEIDIVVRVHPGEALHYGGHESSVDALAEFKSDRLKVIGPKEKVNTYPLMAKCRAGVVFSSTTGIEMAMMGRPVVVGADVYYAKKGFTRDCADLPSYWQRLTEAASSDILMAESEVTSELAALFYYVLHFVQQHYYPYDKPSDVRKMPPHKLIRDPVRIAAALRFLDVITLSEPEFEKDMVNIYGIGTF